MEFGVLILNTIFILKGTIRKIDPTETVVQDVVFYKAEVVIDDQNEILGGFISAWPNK